MRAFALSFAAGLSTVLTFVSGNALADAEPEAPLPEVALAPPSAPYTVCLAGDHSGVADPSARAAFGVLCDSLRKAGAPVAGVTANPAEATAAYRMELQRLDRAVILRVTYEAPVGSPRDSRSLTLHSLDDVLIAADRVSQALVKGQPIEETATVDTLVGAETRNYQKKNGEGYWGFGLYGLAMPAVGTYGGAGIELPVYYETPSLALGGSLRVSFAGGPDEESNKATFGSFSFGGRGFLTEGNIAPYVGGGLGFDWVDLSEKSGSTYLNGSSEGFGAYGEVGIEMLRLYRTRFLVGARVDVPFFSTKMSGFTPYVPGAAAQGPTETKKYAVPITITATFMPFKF